MVDKDAEIERLNAEIIRLWRNHWDSIAPNEEIQRLRSENEKLKSQLKVASDQNWAQDQLIQSNHSLIFRR